MKKLILLILPLILLACGDPCDKITCFNGGQCVEGECSCPADWGGETCKIPACNLLDCKNGGSCISGTCDCPLGYEGSQCATLTRNKFLGTFNGNETCGSNANSYPVTIEEGGDDLSVIVTGLYGIDESVIGVVITENSFDMVTQSYGNGSISGTASTIGGLQIDFTYLDLPVQVGCHLDLE